MIIIIKRVLFFWYNYREESLIYMNIKLENILMYIYVCIYIYINYPNYSFRLIKQSNKIQKKKRKKKKRKIDTNVKIYSMEKKTSKIV